MRRKIKRCPDSVNKEKEKFKRGKYEAREKSKFLIVVIV
jgi:hypothetical protein